MWIKDHLPKLHIEPGHLRAELKALGHSILRLLAKSAERIVHYPHFRKFYLLAALLIILTSAITTGIDIGLTKLQRFCSTEMRKHFSYDLVVDDITYVFPNRIIFKHPRLLAYPASDHQLASAAEGTAYLSVGKILFHKQLAIASLTIKDLSINDHQYFYVHRAELIDFFRKLPKNNFELKVPHAVVFSERQEGQIPFWTSDLALVVSDHRVRAHGQIRRDVMSTTAGQKPYPPRSVSYDLAGWLQEPGFVLDHLFLKHDKYTVNIWGAKQKPKGVQAYVYRVWEKRPSTFALTNRIRHFFKLAPLQPPKDYTVDISTDLQISAERVNINRLDFLYKDMPVYLSGYILAHEPYPYHLILSANLVDSASNPLPQMSWAEMRLSGKWQSGGILSDGLITLFLSPRAVKSELGLQRVEVDIQALTSAFDKLSKIKFRLKKGEIVGYADKRTYRLPLSDLKANYVWDSRRSYLQFTTALLNGRLNGKLGIDETPLGTNVLLSARINQVDIYELKGLIGDFRGINGRLNGRLVFKNSPAKNLSGEVMIKGGKISDVEYLRRLAAYFEIPSLQEVSLSEASSRFELTPQGVDIKAISLKSKDIDFNGQMSLDSDQLIKSQFSVFLTRGLIERSTRFRALLKMADKKADHLQFDFKLSGYPDALNVQWAPSDLKERIQQRVPNFIERKIEQQVDKAMDKVSLQ